MQRELNKNEFYKVRRGYEEALDMFAHQEYKAALKELKPALRLLERDGIRTRMLAKCTLLQARCLQALGKDAGPAFRAALECAAAIEDQELEAEIRSFLQPGSFGL